MKVFLVSPLPPPNGGIAGWTASLLEYYRNNDRGFEIVHQNTSVRSRRVTNTNIFTRIISGIKETRSIYSTFKFNLDYIKPDVVHITTSASLALLKDILLIRLAALRGVPAIIHFHFGRIQDIQMNQYPQLNGLSEKYCLPFWVGCDLGWRCQ